MLNENALTTVEKVKIQLKLTDTSEDTVLESLINSASDAIEQYCNRNFKAKKYEQTMIWNREKCINLKNFPVQSIESFKVDDEDYIDYTLIKETGIIKLNKGMWYESKIKIEYTAGLDSIPAALEQACILYVVMLRGEINMLARAGNSDAGLRQEKIGDWEGEYYQAPIQSLSKAWSTNGGLPDVIKNLIKLYAGRI